jgi:hypothetical protein
LQLVEATVDLPDDQAICRDCGGMYDLRGLALQSPKARLGAFPVVALMPIDQGASALAVDGTGIVYSWSEGGRWRRRGDAQVHASAALLREGTKQLLVVGYGGLAVSDDGGKRFSVLTTDYGHMFDCIAQTQSGRTYCGGYDIIARWKENEQRFERLSVPGRATVSSITAASEALIYATRENGRVMRSFDSGDRWNARRLPAKNRKLRRILALTSTPDEGGVHVIIVGGKGLVFTSEDGENWQTGSAGSADIEDVTMGGDGRLYAVNAAGELLISSDRGLSWSEREIAAKTRLRTVCWSPRRLLVGGDDGLVVRVDDV